MPLPASVTDPILALDLQAEGISTIIWATGFKLDFGWIGIDIFREDGRPRHVEGVSELAGLHVPILYWFYK